MICASPDAFCSELNERLRIVGQEIRPSEIDDSGAAVVVELKRGAHKLQLLQAISYAGMISRWSDEQFIRTLAAQSGRTLEECRAIIEEHTGSDVSDANQQQRVLLLAEEFDPALLIAAEWLHENFKVDIRCYRMLLSQEESNDYLTCTCIYPPVEIASLTRRCAPSIGESAGPSDWSQILKSVENSCVQRFFEQQLGAGAEGRPRYRDLIYRIAESRRFWVSARTRHAHVRQRGRFTDDEEYWREILSNPDSVGPRHEGRSLRFRLETEKDFGAFISSMTNDLKKTEFSESPEFDEDAS